VLDPSSELPTVKLIPAARVFWKDNRHVSSRKLSRSSRDNSNGIIPIAKKGIVFLLKSNMHIDITFFLNFHRGENPHLNLYSVAYKALQPNVRWVQRNHSYKGELKESINKKTHTNTQKEREPPT
jgi:hypothetical protein